MAKTNRRDLAKLTALSGSAGAPASRLLARMAVRSDSHEQVRTALLGDKTRRAVEPAVSNRDLTWHGLRFSWRTKTVDRSLIGGVARFSRSLDPRLGKASIGAKMADVPGHSRGLVAPLDEPGMRFLDISMNAADTPPQVPTNDTSAPSFNLEAPTERHTCG